MIKRLTSVALTVVLALSPMTWPLSAYAEELAHENQASVGQRVFIDTGDGTDATGRSDADSDGQVQPEDAMDSVPGDKSDIAGAETVDVLSEIEYVYIDHQIVGLGDQQSIVVGFSSKLGALDSVVLSVRSSTGDVLTLEPSAIADDAALFTLSCSDQSQIGSYYLDSVSASFAGDPSSHVAKFSDDEASDNSYYFEVVSTELAQALDESNDYGVSALVLDDDGNLTPTNSLDEALSIAASETGDDSGIALLDAEGRSSSREAYLVVAIDPGHGGDNPNASGYNSGATGNGLKESSLTWSISNYLFEELSTYSGVSPYLVRGHYEDPELYDRVQRAVEVGADVFVSVHINSSNYSSANGFEVWVPNKSSYNNLTHEEGTALASKISNQLSKLGLNNRGIQTKDYSVSGEDRRYPDGSEADYYSVIRNSRLNGIPGLIVEHAFISNASDASKLANDSFRKQLGVADATGIARQYGLQKDSTARSSALIGVKSHVENLGWESTVYDSKISGTTGKSLNLEAFQLSVLNGASNGGVTYRASVDGSWQDWVGNGQTAGTTGKGKAIQAIQAKLTGAAADKYDLYYRVHSANIGWLGWTKNGASAGTSGYGYGIQAIEFAVLPKGSDAPGTTANPYQTKGNAPAGVSYQAHVSNVGWQGYTTGVAGTTGRSLTIEALRFSVDTQGLSGDLRCQAHVQDVGWMPAVGSGQVAGTTGRSKRMEAVRLSLTGELAEKYDVWYRVHSQNFGWLGWAKNGQDAGTKGYGYRAEAVEVRLLPKGSDAPGGTTGAFREKPASISYQAHVSDVGWQGYTTGVAGTTGRSLSIEALRFSVDGAGLSGDLVCSALVQDYGWLDAVASGMVAGTTGKSKRMEALRISLTGQLAEKYDVWYRVHSQNFGWLGWAKNGQDAGTKGYGYRAEAVEVRLLPKGSDAPGGTTGAFEDADKKDSVDSESIAIMGSSEVSPERMASYFKSIGKLYPSDVYSEKGAATIEEFCKIVDEEASVEGVRSDIVFAQAMHETGWLSFTGSVRVEQCNFAGLGAVDSSTGGATFDDVRTGIRAQVQHLKAYASKDSLVNECVDPRFSYVKRGCAPYLTDLNGKWAVPGTDYGQRIEKILVVLAK